MSGVKGKTGLYIRSKETKEKTRVSLLGHKHSKETREKIGNKNRGIKHSIISRENMSKAHIGKVSHMKGKKHTIETRKKISEKMITKKRLNLDNSITLENKKIRASLEYKIWREAVFKRDNWTCVWCFKKGCILNADHIKPFAYFPELRFAIDNGRTLCIDCHKTTDTYGNKAKLKK